MNTIEVLKAARELISVPERWIQGAYARTAYGGISSPDGNDCMCWCSYGAVCKVTGTFFDDMDSTEVIAVSALEKAAGMGLTGFNDTHTHAEVIALFDRTIEILEQTAK